jgi:hypothetical protein
MNSVLKAPYGKQIFIGFASIKLRPLAVRVDVERVTGLPYSHRDIETQNNREVCFLL